MTALQMAYVECANWRKDGKGCLGAMIDDDLQIRRCVPRPRCVLSTPGERCQYFEECVAPLAVRSEDPTRRVQFEAAVREYRLAAKLPCADERPCPMCGRAMEPRRRFCDGCAAKRDRANKLAWVQRRRGLVSKVSGFSAPVNTGDCEGR